MHSAALRRVALCCAALLKFCALHSVANEANEANEAKERTSYLVELFGAVESTLPNRVRVRRAMEMEMERSWKDDLIK